LPANANFLVELHYGGADAAEEDRSSIELYLAPHGVAPSGEVLVEADSPFQNSRTAGARGQATLPEEVRVWALLPEVPELPDAAYPRASGETSHGVSSDANVSIEVTARKPDGSTAVLLWIPTYRRDWPAPYIPRDPVLLPAGTLVTLTTSGTPGPRGSSPGSAVRVRLSTSR